MFQFLVWYSVHMCITPTLLNRSIVTPTPIILILGTLTYEAIKKDLKTSHRTVNADVTIDKPIVLFPCKPE